MLNPRRTGLWLSCAGALAAGAAALIVATASGHDEDWRKLADMLPRVEGPIYRAGEFNPIASAAPAFPASGVTLLSHVPLNNFAGNQASGNDCWGYTSPSGREYAIIGLASGFGFVEVTDPTNPVVVETIPGPTSTWHDVKVIGDYAYGVSEGGAGVQVMDLSAIDSGFVTLVADSLVGGHSTTHNIVSNEQAGTLYLAGANIGNGGLIPLDLTDPAAPQPFGGWTDMYVHDAQVVTWNSGPLAGREIAFCASGFDGGITQTGLRVVDMTDPLSPVVLDDLFYPNAGYAHQVWVGEDQQYLYLNDELDEGNGLVTQTTTRVIDVSDPTNVSLVGEFSSGLPATDHNLYVHNGLIYQANYRSGLRVFDTFDPIDPIEIAFFDTFPDSDSSNFNGAWSVYPYFESGTIIVSDIERGLFVLRVDATLQPSLILTSLTELPDVTSAAGGATASISIREVLTTLDPSSVEMVVSDSSGTVRVPGVSNGDGGFEFTLPPVSCGADVTYSFEASTTEGTVFSLPDDPAAAPFSTKPFTSSTPVLSESFESPSGWTVTGNAVDGQWTAGVPLGNGRGDPPADADGSGSAFLTDNDAANSNSDVDDGETALTSPPVTLAPGTVIQYAYWFNDIAAGAVAGGDSFRVQVSTDGGASFTTVRTYTTPAPIWRTDALIEGIDFAASAPDQGRLRFIVDDIGTQNVIEGGLDALSISVNECVNAPSLACSPADLTTTGATIAGQSGFAEPDGAVDLDDLGYFLNFWTVSDASVADLTTVGATVAGQPGFGTPDGAVDLDDLGYILNFWLTGCP